MGAGTAKRVNRLVCLAGILAGQLVPQYVELLCIEFFRRLPLDGDQPRHVPDQDGRLPSGKQEASVWGKNDYICQCLPCSRPAKLLSGGGVPKADEAVPSAGGQQPAVGRESQAPTTLPLALEPAAFLAGRHFPQA